MESFHVRAARPADVGLVAQLNQHVQQLHVAAEPNDFRPIVPQQAEPFFNDLLASPVNVIFIAEESDKTLGYVWAQETQRGTSPLTKPVRTLYIHHIAVDPEQRHMGVGRALVLSVEEEASKRHIDRTALDHWSFNEHAQAFFASMGYEVFNVRMRKTLGEGR
jgi:ribosomal protein S18 acetylase RimI-like enzyme